MRCRKKALSGLEGLLAVAILDFKVTTDDGRYQDWYTFGQLDTDTHTDTDHATSASYAL